MGRNQRPTRLILGYRGNSYKFMNFFVDKHDNSFYFHIYRESGETPMQSRGGAQKGKELKFNFPSSVPTGFPENKISFHKSGYIHSTDGMGQRYRDGVVGIPFAEIEAYMFILVVAPRHPVDMVRLTKIDKKRDIHLHLRDDISPFLIHFAVVRKGAQQLPRIPSAEDLLGGVIMGEYDDKDFGLLIAATKVLKAPGVEEIAWPPFPLVLKRVG